MDAADWRPHASRAALERRAALTGTLRTFLRDRGVLEVQTPVLGGVASVEPTLVSLAVSGAGGARYLRTSPESALKRLLAAGSGDVFEIGPVFRGAESGSRHLTEFTLLEWYRTGWDHHRLMDEVEALLAACGLARPLRRMSYAELFAAVCGGDPHALDTAQLAERVAALSWRPDARDREDRALLFDAINAHLLEPALRELGAVLLYDFPREQRAYARLAGSPLRASRFELFVDGIEIANGYHEIVDADEQAACFAAENALRARRGLPVVTPDAAWLAALVNGLPPCAGIALGIERLLLAMAGGDDIGAFAAFPVRAT